MPLSSSPSNTLLGYSVWDWDQGGNIGRFSSRAYWKMVCKWTDMPALVFKLTGGAAMVGNVLVVASPLRHPVWPWLACTNVSYNGRAGRTGLTTDANNMVAFDYAELDVEFTSLDPLDRGEERIDFSSRVITVPDGTFGYGAIGTTNRVNLLGAESPGLFIPRANFGRTINSLPSIPVTTILSLLGKANNALFLGAVTGTLLFTGASSQRWFTSQGAKQWNVCYSMLWDAAGHNNFLIPGFGAQPSSWQALTDQNGNPPYALADLSALGFTA